MLNVLTACQYIMRVCQHFALQRGSRAKRQQTLACIFSNSAAYGWFACNAVNIF